MCFISSFSWFSKRQTQFATSFHSETISICYDELKFFSHKEKHFCVEIQMEIIFLLHTLN